MGGFSLIHWVFLFAFLVFGAIIAIVVMYVLAKMIRKMFF